jgi:CO/xanthine dehydrogenase FAD-binding subunit
MKPPRFRMKQPVSIQEMVGCLHTDDDARIIAGGQSLMPMLNFRLATPATLVDISRIDELRGISLEPGALRIGATTTHREVERSSLVADHLPLLPYALHYVAHVPIRNKGTIGGSLAHSDPSAEWPALCLLGDAEVEVASIRGRRRVGIDEFLVGTFATDLQSDEAIVAIRFPSWKPQRRWGFQEVSRRQGDFAIAGAAVWVELDAAERVTAAQVVVFAVEDRPLALDAVAQALVGHALTLERMATAGRLAAASVQVRSDLHASAEYRAELVEVLVERALAQAAQQVE